VPGLWLAEGSGAVSKPPCPNCGDDSSCLRLIVGRGEGRQPDLWACLCCGEEYEAERGPISAERFRELMETVPAPVPDWATR